MSSKRDSNDKQEGEKAASEPTRPPWRVEGAPAESPPPPTPPRRLPSWLGFFVTLLVVNWIVAGLITQPVSKTAIAYTDFVAQVKAGNVKAIGAKGDSIDGVMKESVTIDQEKVTNFKTERPTFADDDLLALLQNKDIEVKARSLFTSSPVWATLLVNFGPTLLIIGLVILGTRSMRSAGGLGGIGGIGRSKAVRGDELDAIGRARGGGASFGGVDEREQTLNQILTEMDGFTQTDGVVVIAATNRPDVLDPALLRPGRFDRRIVVNPPDMNGREAILAIHTRTVPLADDVSLAHIASITPGMVGADLKNLVNESALLAAKHDHDHVTTADFTNSLEMIVLGAERNITLSEEDRRRTAFHESGHALLGMLIPGADPVRKISIIPRGNALGVTFQTPDKDRYGYGAQYLRGRITGGLGGRAAEEIVFGNVTTGAESDLEHITTIARQMVGRWGMSDAIGPVSVLPAADANSWYPGDPRAPSEATRQLVDAETRTLIEDCYHDALSRLREHRQQLDDLAAALLSAETLDEDTAYGVVGIPVPEPMP